MKSLEQKLVLSREGTDIWEHTGLAQEPHPAKNIDACITAFEKVGRKLKVIS